MPTLPSFCSIKVKIAHGNPLTPLEAFLYKHEPKYVADEATFLKEFSDAVDFIIESNTPTESSDTSIDVQDVDDELVQAAKAIILQEGRVSTTLLQRRLRLGYVRARHIVETLTARGFLGLKQGTNELVILGDSANSNSVNLQ